MGWLNSNNFLQKKHNFQPFYLATPSVAVSYKANHCILQNNPLMLFDLRSRRILGHYLTYYLTPNIGRLSNIFRMARRGWVIHRNFMKPDNRINKSSGFLFICSSGFGLRYRLDYLGYLFSHLNTVQYSDESGFQVSVIQIVTVFINNFLILFIGRRTRWGAGHLLLQTLPNGHSRTSGQTQFRHSYKKFRIPVLSR